MHADPGPSGTGSPGVAGVYPAAAPTHERTPSTVTDPSNPAPSDFRNTDPALFNDMVRDLYDFVPDLAISSLTNGGTGASAHGRYGLVDVLAYRPGRTPDILGWTARADWAALILFPAAQDSDVCPHSLRRIILDCMRAKVFLIPTNTFTIEATSTDGTFQRIGRINEEAPSVLWINTLDTAPARGDLAPYQVAYPSSGA